MGTLDRAFRNIWRKRMRTGIVLLLLSISLATMVSTFTSVQSSQDKTQSMIDDMETTLIEVKEQAQNDLLLITISSNMRPMSTNTSNLITTDDMEEVSSLDEVQTVVPVVSKNYGDFQDFFRDSEPPTDIDPGARPDPGEEQDWADRRPPMGEFRQGFNPNSMVDYILMGVPLDTSDLESILPQNIIKGQTIFGKNTAMISEELTAFFDADVGSTIYIDGEPLLISGVYNSTTQNQYVYAPLETAQDILNISIDQYHSLRVYVKNETVIDGVVTFSRNISLNIGSCPIGT